MAKDADPQGLRTIGKNMPGIFSPDVSNVILGVLTKPDTLQEGEEDNWLEILGAKGALGSKYKLNNGYFVTKQPALAELKVKLDHSEAREREKVFFQTVSPWKDLPKRFRDRMGVPNLTMELSRLLSQLIEKRSACWGLFHLPLSKPLGQLARLAEESKAVTVGNPVGP